MPVTEMSLGTMVFCLACRNVVWAHDSGRWGDVRGVLNAMRIPCRLCGDENEFKGYDGWTITQDTMDMYGLPSVWMVMHQIADENDLGWQNSPDLVWFSGHAKATCPECDGTNLNEAGTKCWDCDPQVGA